MSRQARAALARAQPLIGSRFRPQGRDPKLGLDCLGVVGHAYVIPGDRLPADYRLRGDHMTALIDGLDRYFRRISRRQALAGDLLLFVLGRGHVHLSVKSTIGFIHADARLGVVETPGPPPWPVVRAFRRRCKAKA